MVTQLAIEPEPRATDFRHGRLYLTFRCNSRCGYCNVWQDPIFSGQAEMSTRQVQESLEQMHTLGIHYVDFTGGEPSLHNSLVAGVRHAASLGMATEVTTNAIRPIRHLDKMVDSLSVMNVSLDTLSAKRYHAIRGVNTVNRTKNYLVELRQHYPELSVRIICTISSENISDVDDFMGFAADLRVPVVLNPIFEYFDGQGTVRDPQRTARTVMLGLPSVRKPPSSPDSLVSTLPALQSTENNGQEDTRREVSRRMGVPWARVSLDVLGLLDTRTSERSTNCGAGRRILTIGPEGQILMPCYHAWNDSLPWELPYTDLVQSAKYRSSVAKIGRMSECRSCTVAPYLGLERSYHGTPQFLLQSFSSEWAKTQAILDDGDVSYPATRGLVDRLLSSFRQLTLREGTEGLLYYVDAIEGRGAITDLGVGTVPATELLSDHAGEDMWRVQRTPHRLARMLYTTVVPELLAERVRSASTECLAAQALEILPDLWEVMMALLAWTDRARAHAPANALRTWADENANVLDGGDPQVNAQITDLARLAEQCLGTAVRPARGWHSERLLVNKVLCLDSLRPVIPVTWDLPDQDLLLRAAGGNVPALTNLATSVEGLASTGDGGELRKLLATWKRTVDRTIGGHRAQPLQDTLLRTELAILG